MSLGTFSFQSTFHSLAKGVESILHQRGFFEDVIPVNFNTVATPHIGLPRYRGFMSKVFAYFGPKLLSRTGEQFYAVDRWSATGRPLLEVMSDPSKHLVIGST